MPAFFSDIRLNTTRLFRSTLTVSGSTESKVDSRNVPPSMTSASLPRTGLRHAQFLADHLELVDVDLGQRTVGVGEQLGQADRHRGLAQADHTAVGEKRPVGRVRREIDVLLTGRGQTRTPARRWTSGWTPPN